ncbi:GMC family oxidoreductase [Microbispora oryzae]|uniref:GMC family oxidoreductase n=1 Tax=Microbispora oryzae TaxID=2806554 RepID=UPI0027DCCD67|nr:GMC family oxidoreductase N-terminal domain-containing protein [Microbispora oryzae]
MKYDYIVVGAGAAGCVAAARLSADPGRSVLLIEAGPADDDPRIARPVAWPQLLGGDLDWGYRTAPQAELHGRRLAWPRGRVVGGSGAINAMVHILGAASDFDAWARWGGDLWTADRMLPLFDEIFDETEAAGGPDEPARIPVAANPRPHPFADAFVTAAQKYGLPANLDFNRGTQEGVGLYRTTRTGDRPGAPARRANTAYTHLRPALGRANLTVLPDATVLNVVVERGRATGVLVRHGGESRTITADAEILLCAGTVSTPHLLMLSGVGPAAELAGVGVPVAVHLPGVGRNLHDHLQVSLAYDTTTGHPVDDRSNLGEAGGFITLLPGSPAPDVQLSFAPMKNLNNASHLGRGFTIGPAITRPRSRGRLTLNTADPAAHPRIDPAYLSDPNDLEILVEGVRIALDIAGTDPLGDLTCGPPPVAGTSRWRLEEYVRDNAETQFHPVGTCRLGRETDEEAVVDPRLRVRGVTGLRIADASVIPSMITGNVHAAVAAIGLRAAEFMREDHG